MSRHPFSGAWRRTAAALALVLTGLLLAACGPATARATTQLSSQASTATTATTTYVALGASDAFGIGTDDPDRQNWPRVLASDLGANVHLVNLGLPGATVADAQRIELPVALASHPNVVTVWLAVNDFANGVDLATYTRQLTTLLDALRQHTHARVYVGNLPDLSLLPYFMSQDPTALRLRVQAWNTAIASICAAEGAHVVDIWSAWSQLASHPWYISSDGLHPSTEGAARLADLFAASIRQPGTP